MRIKLPPAAWLLLPLLLMTPRAALASDIMGAAPELGELEQAIDEVAQYLNGVLGGGVLQELWQGIKNGGLELEPSLLWRAPLAVLLGELAGGLQIFGQLVALAACGLLLVHLPGKEVAGLARQVVYMALFGVALRVFVQAGGAASQAIELMSGFLYALLPVLLTLLASLGAPTAVAMYNPALLVAVSSSLHLLRIFVLPLLYISGALTMGGQLSPRLKFGGLAKLCRDLAMGVFSVMLTLFGALLGLLGLTGAVIDGLGLRAAKSAAGLFIPLVGRTLADSLDTLLSTALLLKNLIGVLGLIILLLICIVPAVRILLFSVLFRLTGALLEPLGDSRLAAAMTGMGGVTLLFFAVTAISGLFFFFIVSITIGMGNLLVAIR